MKKLSIQMKFLVSSALITLLALIMLGIMQSTTKVQREAVHHTDLAGRQRMLTQQITKEAILSQQGKGSQADLADAMELFSSSLDLLKNGGEIEVEGK